MIRKRRIHPIIYQTSIIFSKAMHNKDYELCAKVVLFTVISLFGKEGIINALDRANSFIMRKKNRERKVNDDE